MSLKIFPIQTATSCQLKWNWSTIFLNSGITSSCHRTAFSEITAENFNEFHNTPIKLADRTSMLDGNWPESSCRYCKDIEDAGGVSDRIRQLGKPIEIAPELNENHQAIHVTPVTVEVFFSNSCNLSCLYCGPQASSSIEGENNKFGDFKQNGVILINDIEKQYKDLLPSFWKWFPVGFPKIKRFHFLGGEPFYQKELDKLLEMIEKYPNPHCELNLVTNLMVPKEKLENFLIKTKKLIIGKKLKRLDLTCSIDCWGPEQEYVRWGINLKHWEENFNLLLEHKWVYLNINQTVSVLTIKTMPELLLKLIEWRKHRHVGHWFSGITPNPSYLKVKIFDTGEFKEDTDKILSLMPIDTEENKSAYEYMKGILNQNKNQSSDLDEIKNLIIFLDEKDRRRNTNWRDVFPWLIKYEDLCGIQE